MQTIARLRPDPVPTIHLLPEYLAQSQRADPVILRGEEGPTDRTTNSSFQMGYPAKVKDWAP